MHAEVGKNWVSTVSGTNQKRRTQRRKLRAFIKEYFYATSMPATCKDVSDCMHEYL